jgi:CO/xanthine dehydrogenase FAD-binding subunit
VPPKLVRPRDLREALGAAFVHRTRVRWHAGTSALLNVAYDHAADAAAIVDVRSISDFHAVRSDRDGLSIGAFAAPDAIAHDASIARALGAGPLGAHEARFRLNALGAQVLIAGPGATRSAGLDDFDALPLPAHEIPVAITLRGAPRNVWFGDRRIKRRDGAASFELRVHVALALAGPHRIDHATVAHALDGGPPIPLAGPAAQLRGCAIAKTTFADAARAAAETFRGDDERTNVLRRTIIPLMLSALNDAYAASRAASPGERA